MDPVNLVDVNGCNPYAQTARNLLDALFPALITLELAGAALLAKVSALIIAIAPYLIVVVAIVAVFVVAYYLIRMDKAKRAEKAENGKSRSQPKQKGEPNSVEIVRDADGNIVKYTEYGPNGEIVKEVRVSGKEHGDIKRPNVKEPNFNTNPNTGEKHQNGWKIRPAEPWELPFLK